MCLDEQQIAVGLNMFGRADAIGFADIDLKRGSL